MVEQRGPLAARGAQEDLREGVDRERIGAPGGHGAGRGDLQIQGPDTAFGVPEVAVGPHDRQSYSSSIMIAGMTDETWVLFDYGGVISRDQPDADRAALERAAGVDPEAFWASYWNHRRPFDDGSYTTADYWQAIAADLETRWDHARIELLADLDVRSWLHLDAGTTEIIRALAARDRPMALLSNAPRTIAAALADLPELAPLRQLYFSCDLRLAKPDPDIYHRVLDGLGAPAERVVFIDDRPENLTAAAAVGIRPIHFTTSAELATDLARELDDSSAA
ncbi:HAD family phosphatase [Nocardia terpenica]